jgi:ADP-heptose:LPS heptosyltransferase
MPGRILAIRLSAVGDVINTLPALGALRRSFPAAFIGFLVEDRAHDLLLNHPFVDAVHLYPRRRWAGMAANPLRWGAALAEAARFLHGIRRRGYDVALDFQSNFKGAALGLLSGVRRRVGFSRGHCKEWNHLFSTVRVTPPGGPELNRVDKFLSLAAAVGADIAGAAYALPDAPASRERVDGFLAREGVNGFVAIHPGTSDFGRTKRWPPERFATLASRIAAAHGLRAVVTWGPGERALAEEIVRSSGTSAILALETGSILDLAELLRRARLFVGCDTGPLHLASAVGVPSVALFGPKDPRVYGPYNPLHRVVYKGSNGTGGSMEAIAVEDAERAVSELLAQLAEPARA